MTETPDLETDFAPTTDGEIAANNLESARQQSWSRFWDAPQRPRIAECIVEQEQLTAQFLGDLDAFDRLDVLVNQLVRDDTDSPRTALISAHVAAMNHRFAEARQYLVLAEASEPLVAAADRLSLSIDQACGTGLEGLLEARRRMAADAPRLEELVPFGALLAGLGEFDEADRIYHRALRENEDVSPFGPAWVCFQLGVLWGELVPKSQPIQAAQWYRKAIEYLPLYVKARVHLAEIYAGCGRAGDAEALLLPAVSSGDPEVHWRLADVMLAMGKLEDAQVQMEAARSGFEVLLEKHLLAFADHGAEFYAGSGNDAEKAFDLASINLANRPTLRAFEQAYATAVGAHKSEFSCELLVAAREHWGGTTAFRLSPLATANCHCHSLG